MERRSYYHLINYYHPEGSYFLQKVPQGLIVSFKEVGNLDYIEKFSTTDEDLFNNLINKTNLEKLSREFANEDEFQAYLKISNIKPGIIKIPVDLIKESK